jgi:hypothetical protein
MDSNVEDANVSEVTSNVIPEKENPYFDTKEYYHYVKLAKEGFKDVDLHLIEFAIAEYFIYTVKGIERPKDDTEDFIRAKEKIEKLIEDTRKITKELEEVNSNIEVPDKEVTEE